MAANPLSDAASTAYLRRPLPRLRPAVPRRPVPEPRLGRRRRRGLAARRGRGLSAGEGAALAPRRSSFCRGTPTRFPGAGAPSCARAGVRSGYVDACRRCAGPRLGARCKAPNRAMKSSNVLSVSLVFHIYGDVAPVTAETVARRMKPHWCPVCKRLSALEPVVGLRSHKAWRRRTRSRHRLGKPNLPRVRRTAVATAIGSFTDNARGR
ncbi:hypothetical protein F4780DRAFT_378190 [Xylariomycetidae sp. FL0641]|nr:hypothetical protein F4780DRAFT_378190 [Xylariomycetidae sp. FL0641]